MTATETLKDNARVALRGLLRYSKPALLAELEAAGVAPTGDGYPLETWMACSLALSAQAAARARRRRRGTSTTMVVRQAPAAPPPPPSPWWRRVWRRVRARREP
jgi:hypothetical protein